RVHRLHDSREQRGHAVMKFWRQGIAAGATQLAVISSIAGGAGDNRRAPVIPLETLERHVAFFNAMEDEPVINLVPNREAAAWLGPRIPRFTCPDAEVEEIYFFRWW